MFSWIAIALVVTGLLAEFALLAAWQRNGYWDFSDGVYGQSAHEFLHGLVPYRDFAAAQPPGVYLVGAALLAVRGGLESIRAGMALADLATSVLVMVCVWRLTGLRAISIVAGLLSPLLPISLHEHALLTPETLAAPLLLAGAMLCARAGRAAVGGVLLALAGACKFAFVLPALAIALVSRQRRQATAGLLIGGGPWPGFPETIAVGRSPGSGQTLVHTRMPMRPNPHTAAASSLGIRTHPCEAG